jgi:predicted lipid-binding transport protein (Tim44 family)
MKVGFQAPKENRPNVFEKSSEQSIDISASDRKIGKIQAIYPSFNPVDFLDKAKKVFEMIFTAYSKGDLKTLKGLMSPRIFYAFSMAISDRKKRKETLEGILVRIIKADIVDAQETNGDILITVQFETEQSNVLKSESGEVLEGNSDFIENRVDTWDFSRKKTSTDSRWYLNEIKSD